MKNKKKFQSLKEINNLKKLRLKTIITSFFKNSSKSDSKETFNHLKALFCQEKKVNFSCDSKRILLQ